MDKYVSDPKNDYSVQDMIINLCSSDNGLSVFSTDENLRRATTVSEVFLFISQKCSMYDYDVLRICINSTDCEEAIQIVENFTKELENSLLKDLNLLSDNDLSFKYSSYVFPSGKRRKLTIECSGKSLTCQDKNLIQNIICEKFELPEASMQFITVTTGSVYLIYEISVKVKEHLLQYRITVDIVKSLITCQINCLAIDDEMELKVSAVLTDEVCNWKLAMYLIFINKIIKYTTFAVLLYSKRYMKGLNNIFACAYVLDTYMYGYLHRIQW